MSDLWECYEPEEDADECDHDDCEFDILTGALSCHCGWRRYLSGAEFQRYAADEFEAMETYYRDWRPND